MFGRKQLADASVSALTVLLTLGLFTPALSIGGALNRQSKSAMTPINDKCLLWRSKVDSTLVRLQEPPGADEKSDQSVMEGIECLLSLEGNRNRAKFSGVTRPEVSQNFKPATVEVAALYYVSFLYTGKWDHADAIAIVDNNREPNAAETVRRAYVAYRKWFQRVKKIGLAEARKIGLDPLKGKGVRWY